MSKLEILGNLDPRPVILNGLDDALIGVVYRCGWPSVALYDMNLIIKTLMSRDDMTHEDAVEFFEFNIADGYLGETTPAFVRLFDA